MLLETSVPLRIVVPSKTPNCIPMQVPRKGVVGEFLASISDIP